MQYQSLQQAVCWQLNRPDLLAPVDPFPFAPAQFYVDDRIGFYQSALFSPSEQLDYSIVCIPNQPIYTLPPGTKNIVHIRVLVGSTWLPTYRVDWYSQILDSDLIQPSITSIPTWWATRGQTLRLYLCPNAPYPLELQSNLSPPGPLLPTDANYWTDEKYGAGTLILNAACAEICRRLLNDDMRATAFEWVVAREMRKLANDTSRLDGPLQMRGWI